MSKQPSIIARATEKKVLDRIFTWLDGKAEAESVMTTVRDDIAALTSDADATYVVAKVMALAGWLTQTDSREEIATILEVAKSFFPRVRAFAADAASENDHGHRRQTAAFLGHSLDATEAQSLASGGPSFSGAMARFALNQY